MTLRSKWLRIGLIIGVTLSQSEDLANDHERRNSLRLITGVNETNLAWKSVAEQDATIKAIRDAGFGVIRLTWRRPTKDSFRLFELASREQLGILLDIPAVSEETKIDGAVPRPGNGAIGSRYGLSQLSILKFKSELALIALGLNHFRPKIVGIEFANEANWADFNGDLPLVRPGIVWRHVEDMPDPQRTQFQAGLATYQIAIEEMRKWRANNIILKDVPIVTGGLADADGNFVAEIGGTIIPPAEMILQFRSKGILASVEGIGIHLYGPLFAFHAGNEQEGVFLTRQALKACHAEDDDSKPCWITEFGDNLPNFDCATDADARSATVLRFIREIAHYNFVKAMIFYNWSQTPESALFRCGRATPLAKMIAKTRILN